MSADAPCRAGVLEDYLLGKGVDLTNAQAASSKVAALPATAGYPTTLDLRRSRTIEVANANAVATPVVVLNLTDLTLSRDVVLTLKSANPNAIFIINVKRSFSLNGAKIDLKGIAKENVIYNYVGAGAPRVSGGAKLVGMMLSVVAANFTGGSKLSGKVVGAPPNSVGGGSVVPKPPSVSL